MPEIRLFLFDIFGWHCFVYKAVVYPTYHFVDFLFFILQSPPSPKIFKLCPQSGKRHFDLSLTYSERRGNAAHLAHIPISANENYSFFFFNRAEETVYRVAQERRFESVVACAENLRKLIVNQIRFRKAAFICGFFLILSIDIPRTSFPRKAESFSGLAGGMRFQRRRYASFTHSSASSSSPRMFFAMYPQSFPYFSLVRAIPSSERAKNKSTIFRPPKRFLLSAP